jgi:phosphinothricin acetyltransferase
MDQEIYVKEVKNVTEEVVSSISSLIKELGTTFEPFTKETLEKILRSENTFLYIAIDQMTNKIAGMITLCVFTIPYRTKGWLEDLVVDKSFRGRGVGSMLLEHAIEKAKSQKVTSLNLSSSISRNQASKHLYEKHGFVIRDSHIYRLLLSYE